MINVILIIESSNEGNDIESVGSFEIIVDHQVSPAREGSWGRTVWVGGG